MKKPSAIKHAVIFLWITVVLSVSVIFLGESMGVNSETIFVVSLVICGLFCIFPFCIAKRINSVRYIYSALIVISVFSLLVFELPMVYFMFALVCIPIEFYVIFCLFQAESSRWFETEK